MVIPVSNISLRDSPYLAVVLLSLLAAVPVHGAEIEASLDRNVVVLNESFRLTFEATGKVDGEPDFSALTQDFELLTPVPHRRSNLQIINGTRSQSKSWIFELLPRRAGELTIPAIKFGSDQSQPLTITVTEQATPHSDANSDIFMEVELQPQSPYVQQQTILTVRVLRRIELVDRAMSDPVISGGSVVIAALGKERRYRARRKQAAYEVMERAYAIFPQQSGPLTVEPFRFQGHIVSGRPRGFFDPFSQSVTTKRLHSETLKFEVKPVPPGIAANTWLPTSQLQLREVWSSDPLEFRVGDPITRTIAVIAEDLTAGQLPEIDLRLPNSFKQYPDQPSLTDQATPEGIIGVRQQKTALIPSSPGDYVLPAIELRWWNTTTDQAALARLPERRITVVPAAATSAAPAPSAPIVAPTHPVAPPASAPSTPPPAEVETAPSRWPLLTIGLGLAWMLTIAAWWLSRRRPTGPRARQSPTLPTPFDPAQLRDACANGDAATVKAALLSWSNTQWPESPPSTLSELATRCPAALRDEISALDRTLYARTGKWNGARLLAALDGFQPTSEPPVSNEDNLEPLYRT